MPKRHEMPPPVRAIDAAKSCLQHLSDQERMLMSQVLPPEDAIEAVFKPPEPLPHSYLPTPPRSQGATLAAPVSLRLPKGMRTGRNPAGTLGSLSTEELASGREDTGPHLILPKGPPMGDAAEACVATGR